MTPSSSMTLWPRPLVYFVTLVWALFGLGGWGVVALVIYWDNEDASPTVMAPLVTEGCSSVKWLPPPETP